MTQPRPTLTKEFLSQNTVVFYPRDEEEARAIQERLIRRGFAWGGDKNWQVKCLPECVAFGMTLHQGVIYFHPQLEDAHVVGDLQDFDTGPEDAHRAWVAAGMPVQKPAGVKPLKLVGRKP